MFQFISMAHLFSNQPELNMKLQLWVLDQSKCYMETFDVGIFYKYLFMQYLNLSTKIQNGWYLRPIRVKQENFTVGPIEILLNISSRSFWNLVVSSTARWHSITHGERKKTDALCLPHTSFINLILLCVAFVIVFIFWKRCTHNLPLLIHYYKGSQLLPGCDCVKQIIFSNQNVFKIVNKMAIYNFRTSSIIISRFHFPFCLLHRFNYSISL